MLSTGILGGTFDPVHNAHLHLARMALENFSLDEVWFIPANVPPHKGRNAFASSNDRLEMLQLATNEQEKFHVCDIELRREGVSFTADTLRQLTREFPDRNFRIIIGADNLEILHKWREPETVIELGHPIVSTRPGFTLSLDELRNMIAPSLSKYAETLQSGFLELEPLPISSTEIRSRLQKGNDISDLVPVPVNEYINSKNLYRDI